MKIGTTFVFVVLVTTISWAQTPKPLWTATLGAPVFAGAATDGKSVFVSGGDSAFHALDLKTGTRLWSLKTGGAVRSTPAVSGEVIFWIGGEGWLYALDKSGKPRWIFKKSSEKKHDFADYVQSTPLVQGKTVYFGAADGHFYAVESESGKLKWSFKTGGIIHQKAVTDGENVFFGSFDGTFYALRLTDGKNVWSFKTVGHRYFPAGQIQGSPVLAADAVIFGARDYNVYALDRKTGTGLWTKSHERGWVLANAAHDSVVVLAGADERILQVIEPKSGRTLWKKTMEFLQFGPPVRFGNTVFTGTTIGKFHAIDRKTGETIWTFSTPEYFDNRLKYFKEDDSYRDDIYSIIKSNEHFLDVEIELGGFFAAPLVAGNSVIAVSSSGMMYAFPLNR